MHRVLRLWDFSKYHNCRNGENELKLLQMYEAVSRSEDLLEPQLSVHYRLELYNRFLKFPRSDGSLIVRTKVTIASSAFELSKNRQT